MQKLKITLRIGIAFLRKYWHLFGFYITMKIIWVFKYLTCKINLSNPSQKIVKVYYNTVNNSNVQSYKTGFNKWTKYVGECLMSKNIDF